MNEFDRAVKDIKRSLQNLDIHFNSAVLNPEDEELHLDKMKKEAFWLTINIEEALTKARARHESNHYHG